MLAHAYVFVGPQGVGKLDLALALAKAVTCRSDNPPCLTCSSCTRIQTGAHPDVRVVTRAGASITIDQVRTIQHTASLKPFEASARVFIIDGAETMTREASNALLKLLEEPPPYVYLLLLASDEDSVPETVLSRCQLVILLPLSREEVLAALEAKGLPADQAQDIARLARGRMAWAERIAESPEALEERRERIKDLVALTALTKTERLRQAERLSGAFTRDRDAVLDDLGLLAEGWRDLLLHRLGLGDFAMDPQALPDTVPYSVDNITAVLVHLEKTVQILRGNVNARLAIEAFLLALPETRA